MFEVWRAEKDHLRTRRTEFQFEIVHEVQGSRFVRENVEISQYC